MQITITLTEDQKREIAHEFLTTMLGEKKAAHYTGAHSLSSFVEAQSSGDEFNTRDLADKFKISGHKASRMFMALANRRIVKMVRKGRWRRI